MRRPTQRRAFSIDEPRRNRMHLRRRLVLALALAMLMLTAWTASAAASTEPASGSYTETPEVILEERQSGGNLFVHLTRDAAITGTYTGIGHADQYAIIHSDGTFNFHQTIDFTGTVCGEAVTLTFLVVGKGDFNTNTLTGHYTVIEGPEFGRGQGEIVGQPGVGGTYEGQVHCD
jgi:hypothetical protein